MSIGVSRQSVATWNTRSAGHPVAFICAAGITIAAGFFTVGPRVQAAEGRESERNGRLPDASISFCSTASKRARGSLRRS